MSIRTGMFPPPNAGNTGGPLSYGQGGLPPAPNPFAPMPPMPLAGMPPPPMMPPMMGGGMPPPPMGSGIGSSSSGIQASNAPRRRIFGDYLENTMSSRQPRPSQVSSVDPRYSQTPQFAPRPDSREARPLMNGGIVQGYDDGGSVVQGFAPGGNVNQYSSNRPNMREFIDATGATSAQASQALYGSVGSNVDIRDWGKIMDSENILQATQAATSQMYGSGASVATDDRFYDDAGNYTPTADGYYGTNVGASTGGPKLEIKNGQIYITSSDGLPLTGLSPKNAASFGITQNQIDAAIAAGGNDNEGRFEGTGYVPYDSGNLLVDYSNMSAAQKAAIASSGGSGGASSGASGASYGAVSQPVNVADSIDYSQFNGDVGNFSNTGENFALYGPKINIPAFNSQYISAPSGGLTTTFGPNMTAVSGIGALNMPARPVDLDVLDWLSEPTYGSLNSPVEEMMNGGSVPRQTEIAGQPHMLAYINPEEEGMLQDYRQDAPTVPGPGGIPSYYYGQGMSSTAGNSNFEVSGPQNDYNPTANDDDGPSADEIAEAAANFSAANQAAAESMLSAGIGGVGGTNYNPTANDDDGLSPNQQAEIRAQAARDALNAPELNAQKNKANIFSKYTDNETSGLDDYADQTYIDSFSSSDGSIIPGSVVSNLVNASASGNTNLSNLSNYDNNTLDAVVNYNQNSGNQNAGNNNVTTLTESQLSNASSDNQGLTSSELLLAEQQASAQAATAQAAAAEQAAAAKEAASQAFFNSLTPPSTTSRFPSLDDDSGSVSNASSPSPLNLESFIPPASIPPSVPGQMSTNQMYDPIAPVSSGLGATDDDLETDFSIYDTDTDTAENNNALSLGLGGLRPANVGLGRGSGFKSLEQLKAEISEAEGTSDEGGYDRLLDKGETGTFSDNKPLTEMTLAEAIAFGTSDEYRKYSKDVLGRGPDELPSTPMGKYQIIGTTLAEIVGNPANGFDPNALFDAETQEKLGNYIINKKRNYEDVLSGDITQAEFEKGLGQEFEGIQKDEDFSLSGGSVMNAKDLEAKIASGETLTAREFDFLVNDVSAITSNIEPEFGIQFGGNEDGDAKPEVTKVPVDVTKAAIEAVKPGASDDEIAKIQTQLDASVPVQGFGKFMANVGKGLFLGLGTDFVQGLVDKTESERANIVKMHMAAIENGATPQYDDDGKYTGYDAATAATFGQQVLASDDIFEFMPPSTEGGDFKVTQADIDEMNRINTMYEGDQDNLGQGIAAGDTLSFNASTNGAAVDGGANARFQTLFEVQSKAAELDPGGSSTENGFVTSDGQEYVVTPNGTVVKVENSGNPFFSEDGATKIVGTGEGLLNSGLGTGTDVSTVFTGGDDTVTSGGDDTTITTTGPDTSYTTDENGNRICNEAGYVYDVASDSCIPAVAEEESTDTSLNIGTGASRSFEDVLKNIQTKATTIAPISANIKPMAMGGMAGLNRTADNFLRALGG